MTTAAQMEKRCERALIALHRNGGTSTMHRLYKSAKTERAQGHHLAQMLIEAGLLRHTDRNEYKLTSTGSRKAKQLATGP
jgi:predicted transcriptional regulator